MKIKLPLRCLCYLVLSLSSFQVIEAYSLNYPSAMLHSRNCMIQKIMVGDLSGKSTFPRRSESTHLFSSVKEEIINYNLVSKKKVKSFAINDEINDITKSLLDEKYAAYWSEQLTEDQMESVKFAIQAWSQVTLSATATHKSAENIERILKRLENEKKNGNENIYLTAESYKVAIDIWAKLGFSERAESLLKDMESFNALFPDSIILTNLPYNTVIHSWKRDGEGERAENVLKMMKEVEVTPDEISYNGVVLAYARNYGKYGYADYAQKNLEEMEKSDLDMDVFLFNAVMDAHAKSKASDSAKKAELLLMKMEKYDPEKGIHPNTISYTTVIDAYAKMQSKNSAINAERIFKRMEAAYAAGNEDAKPNNRSFNAVINAYVKTYNPGAALRAETLLLKMIELSKGAFIEAKPNVVTFTTVINGWAKSAESGCGERAQRLYELALEQSQEGNTEASPNSFMYSALIDAWIKSRDRGSVNRALQIFSNLHDNFIEGSETVKPSTFLANQVIDAISRSGKAGSGNQAEDVLDMLSNLYDRYKDDEMKPNAQSYTIAITAWAKSRSFGKAQRAHQLLLRMEDDYKKGNVDAKPNVFAFTAVLNACAFTVGDIIETKEALRIASKTYKELCASDYDKPNSVTFATFLRVVLNLIPKGAPQQSAIISIFRKCCDYGQVNYLILDILMKSITHEQLEKVVGYEIGEKGLTMEGIPLEWKVNVKETARDKRRWR